MELNQGTIDRAIRIALGVGLIALVFFGPKTVSFAIVGIVLLVTGLSGFCPLYRLLGLRTRQRRA